MVQALSDDKLNSLTLEELEERERQLLSVVGSDVNNLSPAGLEIREQQLINRLRKSGIESPSDFVPATPQQGLVIDSDIVNMAISPDLAASDPNDVQVNYSQLKSNPEIVNKIGFRETFAEKDYFEALPFVGSLYKADKITQVINAAKRLSLPDGTLTDDLSRPNVDIEAFDKISYAQIPVDQFRKSDLKLVTDWIEQLNEAQQRGTNIGGRIAEGILELPAFMVEFLLTGPIFKTGSTTAKATATKLLGRYADNFAGRLAVKAVGAGFGTLLRTSVNVPRVLEGAVRNMTEGIQITDDGSIVFADAETNPFSAVARSFADLYIENLTEISGPSIKEGAIKGASLIGKRFPVLNKFSQALADKWIANRAGRTLSDFLKASATKVGYDGILEEMGEERLGDVLRSVTGLQSFGEMVPSMEDLLVEAGVFVVPAGVSLSTNKIIRKDILPEEIDRQPHPPEVETSPQEAQRATVKTKAESIIARPIQAAVEEIKDASKAIKRNVARTEDVVGGWGNVGKKVQKDLREISSRTAKNVGNTSQNINRILQGLSKEESVVVAQLTDGAISKKGQPHRLAERARLLKAELDLMQKEAIDVGLRKQELTGKAFPQIPNTKGKAFLEEAERKGTQSRRVFAWAQIQVNEGRFKSVDSAIAALQNYRRTRLRATEGYFEGQRTIQLDNDMRIWEPDKILPRIIEGGWESIEGARQWGITKDGNFKRIRTDIETIRNQVGVDEANLLEDYIKAQYGRSRASVTARKWNKRARAVQFVGKLAISPLTITRNMLDRYAKGLTHGTIGTNIRATLKFPPFLNRFLKTSQRIQDEMIRQGAVLGHGHLSEGFASGGAISRFIGQGFALSERGNQTYIAFVKQFQMEADLKRLNEMGGGDGTIGKMYNRLLSIIGQSQQQTRSRLLTNLTNEQLANALEKEEVPDDVMAEVLHRTVTDSAFPLTLASKRMWWGNRPFVQTMTQFKIWSTDQMRFIYKDVLKYTIATGDPSRLARFMIGTWLAGEVYNIARDFLLGKDESLLSTLTDENGRNFKDISKSIANALVDGGVIGMLADLTYGITDWAFGPTIGSIESLARTAIAVKNDPATTVDGLKKFLLEDVPAAKQTQGILNRIDRTFFNKEENLTENYFKWRRRSFDFRKKKDQLTTIERTTGRVVLGRPGRLPGPRTLSLEMIARQVLVGDSDDAADYIVGIVKDTPIEKIKDLGQSFRQSMVNNSPMGNIANKDVKEFMSQFSEEGKKELRLLENQWFKNYLKAIEIANQTLKNDDFFEEIKRKAKERSK